MVVSDNGERGVWYSSFARFKEETVVRRQVLSDYLGYRREDGEKVKLPNRDHLKTATGRNFAD